MKGYSHGHTRVLEYVPCDNGPFQKDSSRLGLLLSGRFAYTEVECRAPPQRMRTRVFRLASRM